MVMGPASKPINGTTGSIPIRFKDGCRAGRRRRSDRTSLRILARDRRRASMICAEVLREC